MYFCILFHVRKIRSRVCTLHHVSCVFLIVKIMEGILPDKTNGSDDASKLVDCATLVAAEEAEISRAHQVLLVRRILLRPNELASAPALDRA